MKLIRFVSVMLVLAACGGGARGTDDVSSSTTTAVASTIESTTTTVVATTTTADAAGSAGALTAFRSAAARSAAETSGRYEGELRLAASDQLPEPFTIYLNGAFNSERVELQMDMSAAFESVSASDGVDLAALGDFSDIRFIFEGERAFMKFPVFALMGVVTDWVELPTSDALGAAGIAGVGIGSPTVALASYVDAGADVTLIGTETIRGHETTHYRMLFDVDDLEAVSADVSVEELRAAGIDRMPMEVWIGSDDLIHRYAISFEGVADAQVLSMTYEFYDYGETITIDLPNEDNVTPMDSLNP